MSLQTYLCVNVCVCVWKNMRVCVCLLDCACLRVCGNQILSRWSATVCVFEAVIGKKSVHVPAFHEASQGKSLQMLPNRNLNLTLRRGEERQTVQRRSKTTFFVCVCGCVPAESGLLKWVWCKQRFHRSKSPTVCMGLVPITVNF